MLIDINHFLTIIATKCSDLKCFNHKEQRLVSFLKSNLYTYPVVCVPTLIGQACVPLLLDMDKQLLNKGFQLTEI